MGQGFLSDEVNLTSVVLMGLQTEGGCQIHKGLRTRGQGGIVFMKVRVAPGEF